MQLTCTVRQKIISGFYIHFLHEIVSSYFLISGRNPCNPNDTFYQTQSFIPCLPHSPLVSSNMKRSLMLNYFSTSSNLFSCLNNWNKHCTKGLKEKNMQWNSLSKEWTRSRKIVHACSLSAGKVEVEH